MTKQEQIEEMAVIGCVRNPQAHTAEECAKCDFKQGQCNAYRHAEALYNAGYRKVDDFEAEYERLREVIRQLNTDYNRAWERLKSDCREIGELKAENKQLKTECALLDDELRIARQETIDVRKETAKEIFQKVVNICIKEEDFQDGTVNTQLEPLYFGIMNGCAFIRREVKELAKQYGVEVEE